MTIAQERGCDAIIDDGLLIAGSRIVAGRSAKREETRTAAIRRAIFSAPGHALEVREGIAQLMPSKILILGTSTTMVLRIVSRLGLAEPSEYLNIQDYATPEEIDHALWQRRQEGKHVIPAPAFEVKKTFSGYLVDPLKALALTREQRYGVQERSVVRPPTATSGGTNISDAVVMQIASGYASRSPVCPGCRGAWFSPWARARSLTWSWCSGMESKSSTYCRLCNAISRRNWSTSPEYTSNEWTSPRRR
jgi:hypothetical protein